MATKTYIVRINATTATSVRGTDYITGDAPAHYSLFGRTSRSGAAIAKEAVEFRGEVVEDVKKIGLYDFRVTVKVGA